MAKSNYLEFSESKNWNSASKYADTKIMKLLIEADEYEKIATFGTSEMVEEFTTDTNIKNHARIMALRRLRKTLEMLVNNCKFAVKSKDKETMEKLGERLEALRPLIEKQILFRFKKGGIVILEEVSFDSTLQILINIKEEINVPLNVAGLIFNSEEEFDPDKLKAEITEDMINMG